MDLKRHLFHNPTGHFSVQGNMAPLGVLRSGWRDLNSRPLDPQIGRPRYAALPESADLMKAARKRLGVLPRSVRWAQVGPKPCARRWGCAATGGRPRGLFCSGQLARERNAQCRRRSCRTSLSITCSRSCDMPRSAGVRPDLPRWQARMARCVTAQALFARSGSGIFLLLSRSSQTKGRSSVSFSSGDTAPEPKYRTT
jgi:hypothetical protein